MPVVHCPACRQAMTVPDGLSGRVVACPSCRRRMTLPDAAVPVAVVPALAAEPDFIEPFAVPDAEPRYAPPPRERKRDWLPLALVGGAALLGLIGVVVVVWVVSAGGKGSGQPKEKQEPAARANPPKTGPKTPPAPGASGQMDDATVARIKKATVYIRLTDGRRVSSGSGFFVDKGSVVTNHHVIDHPGKLEVVVGSGTPLSQSFPARVVGRDPERDLALLEVEGAFAPDPLTVGGSATLKETHDVYVFGFPLGENLGTEITVVKSSVSSLRRLGGVQEVQLNGGLHPGNSGGPVTDATGRVVGVAVAAIRGTQIHFAVAGEEVQTFLERFKDRR